MEQCFIKPMEYKLLIILKKYSMQSKIDSNFWDLQIQVFNNTNTQTLLVCFLGFRADASE